MLVSDILDKTSVENELSEPHLRALGGRKDAERTMSKAEKQLPGEC